MTADMSQVAALSALIERRYSKKDKLAELSYLNLSAAFAIPALAHAASLSPPGAPLTATAPIVMSPIMIGTAPWAFSPFPKKNAPGRAGGGAGVPAGTGIGPEGLLYMIVAVAFILATSVVDAFAPSSR